jgi:hypothetical protein
LLGSNQVPKYCAVKKNVLDMNWKRRSARVAKRDVTHCQNARNAGLAIAE